MNTQFPSPLTIHRRRPPAPGRLSVPALILVALSATLFGTPQTKTAADPLQPLEFLVGKWEGTSEGQPGAGTVKREYTRVLRSRFLRAENQNVYPPQLKNPKGEIHEDVGMFSFDRARKRLVLRQFHVEGFVNHYVAEPASTEGPLVFVSESLENIPVGWRARETYVVLGPDEFEEVFELAEAGKPFELYSRARLKRVR